VSKCPKMVVSRRLSLKCGSFASLTPATCSCLLRAFLLYRCAEPSTVAALRMVLTLPPTQPDVIRAKPPAPLPRHASREHVLLAPSRHTRVRAPSPHLVAASRSPGSKAAAGLGACGSLGSRPRSIDSTHRGRQSC
jgi:hypothetical protein